MRTPGHITITGLENRRLSAILDTAADLAAGLHERTVAEDGEACDPAGSVVSMASAVSTAADSTVVDSTAADDGSLNGIDFWRKEIAGRRMNRNEALISG